MSGDYDPLAAYDALPEEDEKARKKAQDRENQKRELLRGIMASQAGRLWVYDLLELCHIYHTSFTPGDTHWTAFKEGERNVGNRLLGMVMDAAPEQYSPMITENKG